MRYTSPLNDFAEKYLRQTVPPLPYASNLGMLNYCFPLSPEIYAQESVPGPFIQTEVCGIHIKNLPSSITEHKIRDLVAQTLSLTDDKITEVKLPMRGGAPKGYAVVSFQERKLVNFAIEALDGFEYNGQKLKVKQDRDQKALGDVRPPHSTSDNYNVPFIAIGSFRNNFSQPTVRPDAQDTSHTSGTTTGTRGRHRQSARRSTSCPGELNSSSRSDSAIAMEKSSRRLSDSGLASPPVVDGFKSRLRGNASTNGKNKESRKLGSGTTSGPGANYDHSRGAA